MSLCGSGDELCGGAHENVKGGASGGRSIAVQLPDTEFLAERIRQDLETQAALLRCRNLGEVGAVQARFFGTAVAQYGDEVSRLLDIGRELATRSLGKS